MDMKTFKIHIDIFDFDIEYYIWDVESFIKKYKDVLSYKYKNKEEYEDCDWITNSPEKRLVFIWLRENNIDYLIHETNHAIQSMLDYMWIKEQWREQTELISNLREYILPKLLKHFWHIKKSS